MEVAGKSESETARTLGRAAVLTRRLVGDFDAVVPPEPLARVHAQLLAPLSNIAAVLERLSVLYGPRCVSEYQHGEACDSDERGMVAMREATVIIPRIQQDSDDYSAARLRAQRLLMEMGVRLSDASSVSPSTRAAAPAAELTTGHDEDAESDAPVPSDSVVTYIFANTLHDSPGLRNNPLFSPALIAKYVGDAGIDSSPLHVRSISLRIRTMDPNHDGWPEWVLTDPSSCGSGGCGVTVYRERGGMFSKIATGYDLVPTPTRHLGFSDLKGRLRVGISETCETLYEYSGTSYAAVQSVTRARGGPPRTRPGECEP